MAVDIDTPVATIEGIGPSIASALETIRVYTVFDLLRRPSQQLHDAVGSHASHAAVGSWKAMASLLQVAEMTPQWAEALAQGGIDTIDELQSRTLTGVQEVFEKGVEEGLIAVTPSADQLAEMQKDASAIRYSGLVMGTILGPTQQVVQGATLRIGHIEGRTDARGRFRLLRIRLGYDTPLLVQHPDYQGLVVEHPRVTPDADVIDIQVLHLMALAAGSTPSSGAGLSELHGDLVPVPYGVAIRQIHKGESELQAGDILMVRDFYASGGDIELVSRLKSYENGEVLVRTFRVPGSRLPGEVKVKDHFRYTGSEFVPIAMSSRALQAYKLRLRVEKAFAGAPEPQILEEQTADFEARLSFFVEHYPFVRPRNAP